MADEYDCELPELNKERTCDYLQESADPKMIDTYDNIYDPAIIEPNKEEVYDYSRSSGVGSEEDEIAARRVEMTVNPSYGIATYSKFTLSKVNQSLFQDSIHFLFIESTTPYMVDKTNMNFMNFLSSMKKEHTVA